MGTEHALTPKRVERALGMMRAYLMECAASSTWSDDRAAELAQTIVACLRQEVGEAGRPTDPHAAPELPRNLLRRAVRFINDNLESKLRWDEIAAVVGLDPFTFARGFRLATGMTPRQYVIRCRIQRAMRLLPREELTLAEIALEVGCSCQSHLTTLFRKHLGTTPSALRSFLKTRRILQDCVGHAG